MLISFEGIDGCGKTTQINLLKEKFDFQKIKYISVREPGSTKISEQIRTILLNPKNKEISSETEALLFASARAQIINEIIIPALNENKIVICDRFIDSTIAYQGYGRGMDIKKLETINLFAIQKVVPKFTFYLDISVEESQMRLSQNGLDRMESSGFEFFNKVRNGYLRIANNNKNRVHVLNGMKSKEDIFSSILSVLELD
jgi:dTMP kinase